MLHAGRAGSMMVTALEVGDGVFVSVSEMMQGGHGEDWIHSEGEQRSKLLCRWRSLRD